GQGTGRSLVLPDVAAITRECPSVLRAAPRVSDTTVIKFRGSNSRTRVAGITSDYFIVRNFKVAAGRVFSETEMSTRARVCLLGPTTVKELFGTRDPLGQRLQVQGQRFVVIGVMKPRDVDWDDRVWVPVTTAMHRLFQLDAIERIEAQAVDEKSLDTA